MAWLGAPDGQLATPVSATAPPRNCQRVPCIDDRRNAKVMLDAAETRARQAEYELKHKVASLSAGLIRAADAKAEAAQQMLTWQGEEVRRANRLCMHEHKKLITMTACRDNLEEELGQVRACLAAARVAIAGDIAKTNARSRKQTADEEQVAAAMSAVSMAKERQGKAEAAAAAAEARRVEAEAGETAAQARADAIAEDAVAAATLAQEQAGASELEAKASLDAAEHEIYLRDRKLNRAARRQAELASKVVRVPCERSADQWATLSRDAALKAQTRERTYLSNFLQSHPWRGKDICAALAAAVIESDDDQTTSLLTEVFAAKEAQSLHVAAVDKIVSQMESNDLGMSFALFLHFEMHLTLDKIARIVNAGGKIYKPTLDFYQRKIVLYHPHLKNVAVKFPRLAPPRYKIDAEVKRIYEELGCEPAEDGRVAIKSCARAVGEMLLYDVSKRGMPPLSDYTDGKLGLDLVFSADATGFGNMQFNTYGLNNPYTSKSAQNLRVIGLGNCDDGREGCRRVLGPNLPYINSLILADECGTCVEIDVGGKPVSILPKVFMVDDVSKIRHGERLANSGWCGCSRDKALRQTPTVKPAADCTEAELRDFVSVCHSPSRLERFTWSHNTVIGEAGPRPCSAAGCTFAHDQPTALAQQASMLKREAELAAVETKAGKVAFSKWRMQHAHSHNNVQPGKFGSPFLLHHFDRQILDLLHLSELGVPKTPWKYGILNNASDDAREAISDQLAEWRHPLDTRRKDNNRVRAQKWFTGEKWATFCAGKGGSPGGPMAIATLVLIIAKDLQARGVNAGMDAAEAQTVAKPKAGKRAANLANFAAATAGAPAPAPAPTLTHIPTALELAADAKELKIIRDLYGSRAQTIINTLLAFDGYYQWYYPLKQSIPFLAPMDVRLPRARDNCRLAIDMQEMFERISIRKHGSFLAHGAVFKVTRDILEVGDPWSVDLSKLELQNAETKRTAAQGGARNLTFRQQTVTIAPQRKWHEGPANIVRTIGYHTSCALSTLRKLLGQRYLSQGDGLWATPLSRQKERLFGDTGTGRTSRKRALRSCAAQPCSEADINPQEDSCISAFVRLLAAEAAAACPETVPI